MKKTYLSRTFGFMIFIEKMAALLTKKRLTSLKKFYPKHDCSIFVKIYP